MLLIDHDYVTKVLRCTGTINIICFEVGKDRYYNIEGKGKRKE
jgi:hypothetical protein